MSEQVDDLMHTEAYFFHDRHLFKFLPESALRSYEEWISETGTEMGRRLRAYRMAEEAAADLYANHDLEELDLWLLKNPNLDDVQIITTTQRFYFGKFDDKRKVFHEKSALDRTTELYGSFSTDRIVGDTGHDRLSGTRRVTVVGLAEVTAVDPHLKVEITPWFIGRITRHASWEKVSPLLIFDDGRPSAHPSEIDQFVAIRDAPTATDEMCKALSRLPEETVRDYISEIINGEEVASSRGGEKSDIFSREATIEGTPVNLAFALNGPGVPGKLTIARMGKNGDQALRLFRETFDIAVVQHHLEIDSAVEKLMQTLARQHGKKYMILDGPTTAHLLGAHGYLDHCSSSEQSSIEDYEDRF